MAADSNWSTPPDSPSKTHRGVISSSYEHAVSDHDWYWDWHHDIREEECDEVTPSVELANRLRTRGLSSSLPVEIERSPPIPTSREQVHDQPPPHLRSSDLVYHEKTSISQRDSGISGIGVGAPKDIDDFPNVSGKSILVAASKPTTVGFSPAYQTSYETTQIASLPGSRRTASVGDSVILLPPKSSSKAPRSIEDVGHKLANYAPTDMQKNQIAAEEYDIGCFNYLKPFGEAKLKSKEDVDGNKISVSGLITWLRRYIFFMD